MPPDSSSSYRPDIDGLRSFAVMSVVLFHADIALFSGGFAGVDVFFVISGFLITRLIKTALEDERFGYGDFYLRRARRLFPALFFTLFLVFVVGAILFLPNHFERLGGALLSALFWCSNVFFWTETGYFDADATLKPLLHTWSLGVEEQFYLVWPTFLVSLFAWRGARGLLVGICAATLLSFGASQYFISVDASGAFYLMPFRVFEFGIGALLVWVAEKPLRNPLLLDGVFATGLALMLVSFLVFTEHVIFPGVNALVPCVGTAMAIYAGRSRLATPILCNPLSIYLGVISYSLYLVHWPVVVFYRYVAQSFGFIDKIAVVVIAILLAAAMYRFVETPLRRPNSRTKTARPFIYGCVASALLLSAISSAVWLNNGWPARWDLPAPILDAATNQRELRARSWDLVKNIGGLNPAEFTPVRLLLVGDSHSKDVFNAIALNAERFPWLDVRRLELHEYCLYKLAGVPPGKGLLGEVKSRCDAEFDKWMASTLPDTADWVALSVRWKSKSFDSLGAFANHVRERTDARVAVFGRTAEFEDVPQMAVRYGAIEGLNEHAATLRNKKIDRLNMRMAAAAQTSGVLYLDKLNLVCNADGEACEMLDKNNNLLLYDFSHWTLSGAARFGEKMAEQNLLAPMNEPLR